MAFVLTLSLSGLAPQAWAQAPLITFDDVPSGTGVNTTYRPLGVVLGCLKGNVGKCSDDASVSQAPNYGGGPAYSPANVLTVAAGINPYRPAFNEFDGYAKAHFLSPVSMVSIYAKSFKPSVYSSKNRPFLQAFDANNKWLATVDYPDENSANWGTWQPLVITRPTNDIQYVVFSSYSKAGGSDVYGVFDNLTYSPMPLPQWMSVTAGNGYSGALKTDGSLWTWGKNLHGQLGNGVAINSSHPQKVGANDWSAVSAGGEHVAAIKQDGTLWTWGRNSAGQLGDGSNADKSTPTQVGTFNDWLDVAAGYEHNLGVRREVAFLGDRKALWSWGGNGFGQLGDGTTNPRSVPGALVNLLQILAISAGEAYSVSTVNESSSNSNPLRSAYAWGVNREGQLGDGTATDKSTPSKLGVVGFTKFSAASVHVAALRDKELWTWGLNNKGQLGNGMTSNVLQPLRLPGAWSAVSAGGQHTVAIKSDGTLWAWGWNSSGQLGIGTTFDQHLPVQIGAENQWVAVAAGFSHTLAVKADGTLWAWGSNDSGQLGDHTLVNKTTPTRSGQLIVRPVVGSRGVLSPSTPQNVDYQSVVPFTVTPEPGYSASVVGCGGVLQGNIYKTAPIDDDCTVTATFAGPRANLIVSAFTLPATVSGGQTIRVIHTVKNSGTLAAEASTACIFYKKPRVVSLRDPSLSCRSVPALAVGESFSSRFVASFPKGLPQGTYSVYLKVDTTGVVDESNEGDNTASRNVTISP